MNAKIEYKRQDDMCVATIEVQEATAEEIVEIVTSLERSQVLLTSDGLPIVDTQRLINDLCSHLPGDVAFEAKYAETEKRIHEGVPCRTSGRIV